MAYTNNSGTVRRPKMEKREVDYSLGNAERHCGRLSKTDACGCKFVIVHRDDSPDMPGVCKLVKGPIRRVDRCNLYKQVG